MALMTANGAGLTRTFDAEWARSLLPKLFFGLHRYRGPQQPLNQ
jgi:hypothetical protein